MYAGSFPDDCPLSAVRAAQYKAAGLFCAWRYLPFCYVKSLQRLLKRMGKLTFPYGDMPTAHVITSTGQRCAGHT